MLVHVVVDSLKLSENLLLMDDSRWMWIQKKPGQMDNVGLDFPTMRHFGLRWTCLYHGN